MCMSDREQAREKAAFHAEGLVDISVHSAMYTILVSLQNKMRGKPLLTLLASSIGCKCLKTEAKIVGASQTVL